MRPLLYLSLLLLLMPMPSTAAAPATSTTTQTTYCDDEETRRDWQARTDAHPEDTDLQALHALWLGLCVKIHRGGLAADDAADIFERWRHFIIEQQREQSAVDTKPERE